MKKSLVRVLFLAALFCCTSSARADVASETIVSSESLAVQPSDEFSDCFTDCECLGDWRENTYFWGGGDAYADGAHGGAAGSYYTYTTVPEPRVLPAAYAVPCVGSVHESLANFRTTSTSWPCASFAHPRSIACCGSTPLATAVWADGSLIALTVTARLAPLPETDIAAQSVLAALYQKLLP